MTRKTLVVAFTILFAVVLYAKDEKNVKLTGYLLDNNCTAGHANDKDFAEQVKKHPTSCAKMEACEKAGYAVYADKKLYKLDGAGNDKAEEVLKNTKATKGVMVTVEGTVDGDTIKVTKLTEVTSK
jgi:Mn-dependent DtxR family transcriptional regulator